MAALARALRVPVIAEGCVRSPEEAAAALPHGAHSVVGTAITAPTALTRRIASTLPPA